MIRAVKVVAMSMLWLDALKMGITGSLARIYGECLYLEEAMRAPHKTGNGFRVKFISFLLRIDISSSLSRHFFSRADFSVEWLLFSSIVRHEMLLRHSWQA